MSQITDVEVKISIAKLFELAYSENKDLTAKIVAQKGGFKITVDQSGNASLSGSAGILTFKGTPALADLGLKVKNISVTFNRGEGFNVGYTASYTFFGALSISTSGILNIEKLITACSGLLCIAARGLKGGDKRIEDELTKAMGY